MMSNRLSLFLSKLPFENFVGCEDEPDAGAGGAPGSSETQTGGAPSGSENQTGDPQKKIAALEEEKNRHYTARQQAETELEELRKFKKEQEDKGKSEQELATSQISELKAQNSALVAELNELRIRNAFLSTNTVEWHNPERALALVDLSEVQIDKDGNVDRAALKAASEALAKSDAYLVKSSREEDKKDPAKQPGSGKVPGQGAPKDTDLESLKKKYPALRNRG